ncbi:MAG TPA: 3-oxoacyl-ACP reductase family protein [Balneolales bacterium]|nr:3-oxoacyl-ACP reductase family protein [Balneolales bacterium]
MNSKTISSELTGKTALITGSSRGIGRAITKVLANSGLNVVINYNRSRESANPLLEEIEAQDGSAIVVRADVSKTEDIKRLIKESIDAYNGIDILINNAAIAIKQDMDSITEKDWDHVIDTNLKSVFLVTQMVLPQMRKKQWGRIINLSSVAAFTGGLVGPHYTASKAGIIGLTRYYAARLAKENITVNAIAPAIIETEMVKQANLNPDVIPVGRFGQPEEVANLALMLTRNGYITGQTFNVDGGLYFK